MIIKQLFISSIVCVQCIIVAISCAGQPRYEISIEETVNIVNTAGGMMNLVRAPDGTLYLLTQTDELDKTLVRSSDEGKTWEPMPVHFRGADPNQIPTGFGISRDGKLWILHQQIPDDGGHGFAGKKLYVSTSEHGKTWKTSEIDFAPLAPGGPDKPYATANSSWCYCNFVEDAAGTLMFSTSLRYADWADWLQEDQTRPGVRDVMIRSHDRGKTWGDATIVHQHATETDHAVDPFNPNHILSASRKQRKILANENRTDVEKEALIAGTPHAGTVYPWKGGLLLESFDAGRTFREVPDSYTGFYGHRGNILWTKNNVVIFSHCIGKSVKTELPSASHVARISLDGGKTWLSDKGGLTPRVNQSKRFLLVHDDQGVTIDVANGRYLTVIRNQPIRGFFWQLKEIGKN